MRGLSQAPTPCSGHLLSLESGRGLCTQNMALLRLCWEIQPPGFTSICSIFITHWSRRAPSMNSFRDSWPERGAGEMGMRKKGRNGAAGRGERRGEAFWGVGVGVAAAPTQRSLQSGA